MESRRIVFSTATPNDQGGIIPNDVIQFGRYEKNPVILKAHDWEGLMLGQMTDIKLEGDKWTGVPVFHRLTAESREYDDLYQSGFLKACSIGGLSTWATDRAGRPQLDKNGCKLCTNFDLYEVSMVSLPSNPDAVTELSAKLYDNINIDDIIENQITTLSSKIMENKTQAELDKEAADLLAAENVEAEKTKLNAVKVAQAAPIPDALPPVIKDAIKEGESKSRLGILSKAWDGFITALGGMSDDKPAANIVPVPAQQDKPKSTIVPDTDFVKLPPVPAKFEAEKAKMEATKEAAEKAVEKAEKAKPEEKEEAMQSAEECMKAADEAEAIYKAKMESEDDEEVAAKKEKTTNSAAPKVQPKLKPEMKDAKERLETLKLAAKPEHHAKVNSMSSVTFSQLNAKDNTEGQRILNRVMTKDGGQKEISDYAVVANAMLNDGKFAAVVEKTRFMQNVNEAQLGAYQSNPQSRSGLTVREMAAKFNSGYCSAMGKDNTMREVTTLNATDDFLASPDLFAMEFLSLAIFKLFPSTSWKNDIPIFGAQETGNNTGLIWANIAADPTIYRGSKPVNPVDYTYDDQAVALNLTPYWLQPMLWTPLTMHQLRYDQMSTGWAQAFAKWGAVMDDDLIYTLASTVPKGSIVYSSGPNFTIQYPNSPNQFYYNPTFSGTLNRPVLNDILTDEQIYLRQNFELQEQKPTLVLDPTAYTLLKQDPETKSLLTRWVNQEGAELFKFSNTILNERSRVAIFDPSTEQVKDPRGAIPASATSANLGFIPSQVGIGLGMLDVFMIQDPSNYGYRMSADIRIGIVPLRKNYDGTSLLVYGPDRVS